MNNICCQFALNLARKSIKTNSINILRTFSSTNSKQSQNLENNDIWLPIYHFKLVRFVAAVNKLKLYQVGLTGLGIPLTYALEKSSTIPEGASQIFAAIGNHNEFLLIYFYFKLFYFQEYRVL